VLKSPENESLDDKVGRHIAKNNNIFTIFGHGITVVTWISFCVVSLAIIDERIFNHLGGIRGKPLAMMVLVIGFAHAIAIVTSLILLFSFIMVGLNLLEESEVGGNRFIKWMISSFGNYIFFGFVLLIVAMAWSLSTQALIALGLQPL